MKLPTHIVIKLVHILGPMKGSIQEFSEGHISIGRDPYCHLKFPADLNSISRKHADIMRESNRFKLIDRSVNGTYVNGKRVDELYLKNGDVLEFAKGGPKVSFLTELKEISTDAEITIPPPRREKAKKELQTFNDEKFRVSKHAMEKPVEISVKKTNAPLIIQYGPTLRSFKELPVTIGKNPNCEFILDHPSIFDKQAQIFFNQNQYWVKDLTGQKFVQINNKPIVFHAPLKPNDEISLSPLGPTFRFIGEGRLTEVA